MRVRCRPLLFRRRPFLRLGGTEGAELVELALVLPLLLVMLTGLLDFAHAYNIKQKLSNAAREGARMAISQASSDLQGAGGCVTTTPASVQAIRDDVVQYLNDANVDTSFIPASGSPAGACAWSFYSSGTYGLLIERNIMVPTVGGAVSSTRITVTYPYNWTFGFNRLILFLLPTSSPYAGVIPIPTDAIMQNLTL